MPDIDLYTALIRAAKRAETSPEAVLREAFVPVGSLLAHLESAEHQVLFGRRGTGKTHLLRHLEEQKTVEGRVAVYIDLRRIGSPEDIYSAGHNDFLAQATPLLVDVVEAIHNAICDRVLSERAGTPCRSQALRPAQRTGGRSIPRTSPLRPGTSIFATRSGNSQHGHIGCSRTSSSNVSARRAASSRSAGMVSRTSR